jgi:hypothetical protein
MIATIIFIAIRSSRFGPGRLLAGHTLLRGATQEACQFAAVQKTALLRRSVTVQPANFFAAENSIAYFLVASFLSTKR